MRSGRSPTVASCRHAAMIAGRAAPSAATYSAARPWRRTSTSSERRPAAVRIMIVCPCPRRDRADGADRGGDDELALDVRLREPDGAIEGDPQRVHVGPAPRRLHRGRVGADEHRAPRAQAGQGPAARRRPCASAAACSPGRSTRATRALSPARSGLRRASPESVSTGPIESSSSSSSRSPGRNACHSRSAQKLSGTKRRELTPCPRNPSSPSRRSGLTR